MQTATASEQMIEQQVRAWEVLDARVLGPCAGRRGSCSCRRASATAPTPTPRCRWHTASTCCVRASRAGCCRRCCRSRRSGCWRVGAGSGYVTACLACLPAPRCARWSSIRPGRERARQPCRPWRARRRGRERRCAQCHGGVRYDAIAVTASLPVYDARFERMLAVGGRLFIVVGEAPAMDARLVTRTASRRLEDPEPVRDGDRSAGESRAPAAIYLLSHGQGIRTRACIHKEMP